MKINNRLTTKGTKLSELSVGDVFMFHGGESVCMVLDNNPDYIISSESDDYIVCVCLNTGETIDFSSSSSVYKVDAELNVLSIGVK